MTSPAAALAEVGTSLGAVTLLAVGVGIDLVELADVAQLVEAGGEAFVESAWTANERAECEDSIERLAARWAAKEAVMKALGAGLGQISPLDIEVWLDPESGAPQVQLHRQALACAQELPVSAWFVSLCHENGWAAAIAIARRDPPVTNTEPLGNASIVTTNDEGR